MTGHVLGAPDEIPCPHGAHTLLGRQTVSETLCSEVESGRIGAIRCWGGS